MNNQDLKKQIRRKLHARNKEVFAEDFMTCPKCKGTLKVCVLKFENDTAFYELESCSECGGEVLLIRSMSDIPQKIIKLAEIIRQNCGRASPVCRFQKLLRH